MSRAEWGPDCPTSPCEGPACPCCGDAAEEALADLPCLGPSCVGCPACDPLALAGRDEVRQVLQRMRGMRAEGLPPTPVRCDWDPDCTGPEGCPYHGEPRCYGCGEVADHGASCVM